MVVFDTSLLIDATRGKKYVLDLIDSYRETERAATTIVTKYELLRGVSKGNLGYILELLGLFEVLDFEDKAVEESVKAYKSLKEKGKTISELDFLIIGIAVANNETLLTRDKDFLKLENNTIKVLP
jgi:predicted nucleic acid-binding protein